MIRKSFSAPITKVIAMSRVGIGTQKREALILPAGSPRRAEPTPTG